MYPDIVSALRCLDMAATLEERSVEESWATTDDENDGDDVRISVAVAVAAAAGG